MGGARYRLLFLFAGKAVFPGGTAAVFPEIPGEVLQAGKAAETGRFLYLEGLVAQETFGFFHAYMEEVSLRGGGKEMVVINIKLGSFSRFTSWRAARWSILPGSLTAFSGEDSGKEDRGFRHPPSGRRGGEDPGRWK